MRLLLQLEIIIYNKSAWKWDRSQGVMSQQIEKQIIASEIVPDCGWLKV